MKAAWIWGAAVATSCLSCGSILGIWEVPPEGTEGGAFEGKPGEGVAEGGAASDSSGSSGTSGTSDAGGTIDSSAIDAGTSGGPDAGPPSPSCTDGVTNGAETDTDCGGGTCLACVNGKACVVDADCKGRVCNAATKTCEGFCGDGVKNGSETDVDCGGPVCLKCVAGRACNAGTDCVSGICTNGICKP